VLLGLAGCTSKPTTLSGPVARIGEKIDPATVGSISGTVSFTGTPPKRMPIDMSQDPACSYAAKEPNLSEAVLVADGKLANAFVYVKQGPEKYAVPVPAEPAILDQKGCRYHPHVMGLVAGQKLRILNSDPAMHNVHPTSAENESWNVSQMPGAAPIEKTFTKEELMLRIICNQHPWMKMYVNVLRHPFFAVSDAEGNFEIKGLPPGDYTLGVMHEKLGAGQEMQVKLAPKEAKQDVRFTYPQAK
jgi:plastocyanin